MANQDTRPGPSEYDARPGEPQTNDERLLKGLRDQARREGEPVPPIAGEYTGWDRS